LLSSEKISRPTYRVSRGNCRVLSSPDYQNYCDYHRCGRGTPTTLRQEERLRMQRLKITILVSLAQKCQSTQILALSFSRTQRRKICLSDRILLSDRPGRRITGVMSDRPIPHRDHRRSEQKTFLRRKTSEPLSLTVWTIIKFQTMNTSTHDCENLHYVSALHSSKYDVIGQRT